MINDNENEAENKIDYMRLNRLHRYDINRPRLRHGY